MGVHWFAWKSTDDAFAELTGLVKGIVSNNRYFIGFVAYTFAVSLLSGLVMHQIQSTATETKSRIPFIDAFFLAVSAFSNTGLESSDYTLFRRGTLITLLVTVEMGNLVLLTAVPSMIRIIHLRKELQHVDSQHAKHKQFLQVHYNTNRTIIFCCVFYFFVVHLIAIVLFWRAMPLWWSIFHTITGFNNAGFGLSSASFADPQLATNNYVLIVMTLLMPMGNTLYPVVQRFVVRGICRVMKLSLIPKDDVSRIFLGGMSTNDFLEGLKELLVAPRSYYSHLFTPRQTTYLFLFWSVLSVVDFLMFVPEMFKPDTRYYPDGSNRFVISWFQTVTTRTTGFCALNLVKVSQGHLSYWILAMYLSSYPFIITERTSKESPDTRMDEAHNALRKAEDEEHFIQPLQDVKNIISTIGDRKVMEKQFKQIKSEAQSQISKELGWLWVAIMLICFFENDHLLGATVGQQSSFLRIVFELSSAYGTVGLSLNSPDNPDVSYSGVFKTSWSKFVVLCVMFCGKLRGLPANEWDQATDIVEEEEEPAPPPLPSVVSAPPLINQ